MKTFRYERGHAHYKTMTVGEMVDYLQRYPSDMPVMATWEGVCCGFEIERSQIEADFHGGLKEDACDVLMFDVDAASL